MNITKKVKIAAALALIISLLCSQTAAFASEIIQESKRGKIMKNGDEIGDYYHYIREDQAEATTTDDTRPVHNAKNTYMTLNVKSIYIYGGTHAYYVKKNTEEANAWVFQKVPTTERATSIDTTHIIIVDGTAYTPYYPNGYSIHSAI